MISDATMRIGSSHHVCEDYARATTSEENGDPITVVADGCSSSPDTDCGARLLVLEALETMNMWAENIMAPDVVRFYRSIVHKANQHARIIGLDPLCLDATLLTLRVSEGKIVATCWGDGVIVHRLRSGIIHARIISYPNGFPSYPSYLLDPNRERYCQQMNDVKKTVVIWNDGKVHIRNMSTDVGLPCEFMCTRIDQDDPIAAVAIFSDGIHSFSRSLVDETSKTKQPVEVVELLPKLMAFRGKGEFARRRLNGLLRKEPDLSHYDDVSMGAILLSGTPD